MSFLNILLFKIKNVSIILNVIKRIIFFKLVN